MSADEGAISITVVDEVDEPTRQAVQAIEAAALEVDGVGPLDDQVRLDLQFPDRASRHLLATAQDGTLVGYAHVRHTEEGPSSAHAVVAPDHRRHGVGTALIKRLVVESGDRGLRVWAHGDEAAARFLSGRLEFTRVRDLWQMRRSLSDPLDEPRYPPDVTVRTFEAGRDEDAWLDVNARAFADHPEQGGTERGDLDRRMRQPWFDPEGFFLAERGGELLGFHWTKEHRVDDGVPHVGEVYVVGVAPEAQGLGLGKALTLTGLRYLRDRGLDTVVLYVEADNTPAVAVYEKLGFTTSAVDVMYERR